jgi:membrane protein implicated in regulation of membrane protease activity
MDIQLLVVLLVTSVAFFYLFRKFYRQLSGKEKPGCENCGSAKKENK